MTRFRSDGLDSPMSPNGPHPLYFLRHQDGSQDGPYSCPREAELATECLEDDEVVDHAGRVIDRE